MYIIPISQLPSVTPDTQNAKSPEGASAGASFESLLKSAIHNLEEVQNVTDQDSVALALGQSDDLHSIQINTMKATAAIELAASVTSKALSAYKEVLSMQI